LSEKKKKEKEKEIEKEREWGHERCLAYYYIFECSKTVRLLDSYIPFLIQFIPIHQSPLFCSHPLLPLPTLSSLALSYPSISFISSVKPSVTVNNAI
jgi:hypothetical protein